MTIDKPRSKLRESVSGISKIFLDNSTFLRKFLKGYLGKERDVEDVLQQTFLNVYNMEKNGGKFDKPKSFLFTVARNLALNELSRKSREITDFIEDCKPEQLWNMSSGDTVEHEVEAHEALGVYCEAIALLPVKCRQVYLLRKVHGLSHKDIAQTMGISVNGVEKHLFRGMLKCREYIESRDNVDSNNAAGKTMATSLKEGGHE